MSLTSALKNPKSPLGRFVAERLANSGLIRDDWKARVADRPTLRPPAEAGPTPWSTIGMAIDYRIRYYFAVTPPADLVAVHGGMWKIGAGGPVIDLAVPGPRRHEGFIFFDRDDLGELPREEARSASSLAWQLVQHLTILTDRLAPVGKRLALSDEAELARVCYALALYEELYRVGPMAIDSALYGLPAGATLDDLLGLVRPVIVDDLCELSWAFYDGQTELIGESAVLNPTFAGSRDVGGADADLIVGGCLMDIKATVNPIPLKPLDLSQIVCYALLDYDDQYAIESVGIYLARQALLIRWRLADLVFVLNGGRSSVEALRHDLREVLTPGSP